MIIQGRKSHFNMATYSISTNASQLDGDFEQSFAPLLNYTPPKKKCCYLSGVSILYLVLFFHRLSQFCLTWSLQLEFLSILQVYENIYSNTTQTVFEYFISVGNIISYGLGYLLAPLFGYLADAYWGRYRVILGSLCLLSISILGKTIFIGILIHLCPQEIALDTYIPSKNTTFSYFSNFTCFAHVEESYGHVLGVIAGVALVFFFVVSSLSYSGIFANLCPFFVDQLEGSSELALTTLFHKYYWVSNLGSFLAAISIPSLQYFSFSFPFVLSVLSNITSIVLIVVFKKKFISQPPSKPYPLSLIKKVVLSSFRRREDDINPPSSKKSMLCYPTEVLNRAKVTHGGRFQIETVEESKAFFRLLIVFFSFMGIYYMQSQALGVFNLQAFYLKLPDPDDIFQRVVTYSVISNSILIFDPIAIILVQPLLIYILHKLGPWAPNQLQRMGLGYVFALLGIAAASLVDVLRVAFPCRINVLIQIPQYVLMGLAESLGIVSHMEFTYAQSPYTMKGMLFGFMQFSRGIGIYSLIFFVVLVSKASSCSSIDISDLVREFNCSRIDQSSCLYYSTGQSSNALYFWLMNFLIALMGLPLFIFVAYRYSQRRRHYTD